MPSEVHETISIETQKKQEQVQDVSNEEPAVEEIDSEKERRKNSLAKDLEEH